MCLLFEGDVNLVFPLIGHLNGYLRFSAVFFLSAKLTIKCMNNITSQCTSHYQASISSTIKQAYLQANPNSEGEASLDRYVSSRLGASNQLTYWLRHHYSL